MLWIEIRYINIIGTRLRNFKRKSDFLWNMSCPICGDSKRRKHVARGYVYRKGDKLNYDCKNCGSGMSAKNFIKHIDPELYREMQLELFAPVKHYESVSIPKVDRPVINDKISPFDGLIKI